MHVTLTIEAESLSEISNLLTSHANAIKISSQNGEVPAEVKPEEPKGEIKTRKQAAKKQPSVEEGRTETVPDPPAEEKELEVKEETKKITLEEVRAAVAEKAKTHRTEIKALLTSFAAQNVTSLKEENYSEFLEKLNNL